MKKIKKLGVAAVVLAMCALLGITVWAAEGTDATAYSYTVVVEAGKSEMCVSDQAREVTVTVKADKAYAINSLDATVTVSGCTVKSVTMPVAAETDWSDYNAMTGHFGWFGLDSLNKNTQDLLTIVIEIPAGAEAGDCTVTVTDVMLTQLTGEENDHAMITLTGKTISSYVTVKVKAHKFEAEAYHWSQDASSCTAVGKCACGADATATATIKSEVTKNPSCKEDGKGETTYTATFNATWAEKQTLTLTNIPKLEHSYTGGIRNDGNSKDGTHSFMCVNGCQQYGGAVAHSWDEGKETTAPGCTTTGVMTYTCKQKDCGATYTEEIPAHGHTFGETVAANDATCTAPGNEAYKQCETCGKFFAADAAKDSTDGKDDTTSFVTAQLDHSYTGEIKNDGDTHSYKCVNGCNLYGDAVGHTYTNGECVCGDLETYTVTWVKENGDVVYTETVKYGKDAQNIPQLPYEKPGYTASWSHNGKGITQNTTIKMVFTENTYRVEIYSASGINTLGTKEGLYTNWISTNIGNFSSLVTPVAGYDAGFSLEPNGEMVCGTNIRPGNLNILTENAVYDAGTGKYVLKLYVARTPKTYYITWYVDGKMYDSMSYKYGEAVSDYTYTPSKSKNGCTVYTFDRWDSELPETMPAQNVTINAIFMETKDHTDGTVSYQDNENGTHDAICSCGTVLEDNATHIYTDGECVCGAEKPAPAGLKGDMNSDGVVDMDDVIALLSHVMKVDGEIISDQNILARGEVTGDTTLDMDDVIKVLQYVMKAGVDTLD